MRQLGLQNTSGTSKQIGQGFAISKLEDYLDEYFSEHFGDDDQPRTTMAVTPIPGSVHVVRHQQGQTVPSSLF